MSLDGMRCFGPWEWSLDLVQIQKTGNDVVNFLVAELREICRMIALAVKFL
jgi:hypothetical protein